MTTGGAGRTDHDVVIVGAGLAGAGTAWRAAAAGLDVLVLEQFTPHHGHGSSHGSARIVRRAYADGLYAELTGQAFELWREAELASGTTLVHHLGAVDFGPQRRTDTLASNLAANGCAYEMIGAEEAMARWPGMVFDHPVLYHPQAGTVDARAAVDTFLDLARSHGAQVRFCQEVGSVVAHDESALVQVGPERIRTRAVVLAAGAWLPELTAPLHLQRRLPELVVTEEQTFHFPRRDPTADPWPSVIHAGDGFEVYHLSGGRDGGPGLDRKIAQHHHGIPTTARDRPDTIVAEGQEFIRQYVRRWLPGLHSEPANATTCLYTTTPTHNFLIDRVGPVVLASACSGHGAKFAPLIGHWTTALLTGRGQVPERFALAAHGPHAPATWSL